MWFFYVYKKFLIKNRYLCFKETGYEIQILELDG